jgi:hypothetical protein
MTKDIIYQSETDNNRIMLSRIGAFVTFLLIIWAESWLWKITSFGPVFFFLLFSGVVFAFLGTLLYYLIKYASLSRPALVVFQDKFWMGDEVIPFNEIEDIVLINDKPAFSKWSWPEESVTIKLNSGEDVIIAVSRYRNGNLFRTFCEKIKAGLSSGKFEVNTLRPTEVVLNSVAFSSMGDEIFKEFRPSPFVSIIFYYSLIILIAGIVVLSGPVKNTGYSFNVVMSILFFALFFASASFQKHFLVSDKYLVIKYYFYFWIDAIIRIEDIRKIEILRAGRSAKLSITTKDYKLHSFFIDPVTSSGKINEMIQAVNEYAGIKTD